MSSDAQEAFQRLADSLSQAGQRDFFPHLAKRLADLLAADHVFVARVLPDGRTAATLAAWSRGGWLPDFDYTLAGTPCEGTLHRSPCQFPAGVCQRFPDDHDLQALGAEAYLGVPMFAPDGGLLGLVAVLYDRPQADTGLTLEILRIAASRAGAELAGQEAERALSRTTRELASTSRRLSGTHRALTLLRLVNRAVIRAEQESALLGEICRLACREGGYRLAWVGYALHDEHRRVMPQAFAGHEEGYLDEVWFSWDAASPDGQAPPGRCIRSGRPVVLEDLQADPAYAKWARQTRRRGYRGVIALPLRDGTGTFGALMLLKASVGAVGDEERGLLAELADNLSFGLQALRVRLEQERTERAVLDMAEALTARGGQDFFPQLTRRMVGALGADAGFISRLEPGQPPGAVILAGLVDGEPIPASRYALAGTPCQRAFERQEVIITDGLGEACSGIARVDALGARAYVGRRLDDAAGRPVGAAFVLYRRPLVEAPLVSHLLRIFAAGAAAELERHRSDAHIRHLAYYDSGTGLPNRACFMERLGQALARTDRTGGNLALLFMDLNRFKEINDSQGHDVGDRVLVEAARRFRDCLVAGASLARLGGDEFVVMIEGTDHAGALAMVEGLAHALSTPVAIGEQRFVLEVSIGVAFYPEHADSARELLKHTDFAMYRAKQSGAGYRFFDAELGRAMTRRLTLASRLAAALDAGGLSLHYQPSVDLASGELIGAEVLCRWHDPVLGWVSPAEFIPVAAERGMIARLGEWVLRAACAQLADWRQAGGRPFPGRVNINVAAQQLEDSHLAEHFGGIVRAAGLTPAAIGLELTESDFMADPEQAVTVTRTLRRDGFALSIDDFGTGYSSLAYLKRFAVDAVKIDMSFVRDMLHDDNDRAIVTTIIAMADSLGLVTVAEGVESRAQAEALLALGCRRGQGFLFDRALPADAFARRWLANAPA